MRFVHLLEKETFQDLFKKKNKWVELVNRGQKEEIKKNLYVLIDTAYGKIGGHIRIKKIDDILNPTLTYWEAVDIDDDPDADVVIFGRKEKGGIKISGFGHDGDKKSRSDLVNYSAKILKKKGYFIEVSGKPAEIYKSKGVKTADQKTVEKLFGKGVKWIGDGWYERKHDFGVMKKQLMGNPKI